MKIQLHKGNREIVLNFSELTLVFEDAVYGNVFGRKNNKTVAQTVLHERYQHLAEQVKTDYPLSIHLPIGCFLLQLKGRGDNFYKEFLNDCGDLEYCRFHINSKEWSKKKGVYIYMYGNQIKYVGRCISSFEKRINNGYGRISPKNCFKDGQKTNCHLNNLILINKKAIHLFVCEMINPLEIKNVERQMIQEFQPDWNIALR